MSQTREISLSIGGRFQDRFGELGALDAAARVGAKIVDFSTMSMERYDVRLPDSIYSKSDEEIVEHFTKIRKRAEELGLRFGQTHGKSHGFVLDKEEDAAHIENIRRDCLVAATLGAPICVLHGVTTMRTGPNVPAQTMRDANFEMFTKVIPFAKQYGIKLATETFGDAVRYDCCDFFGQIDEFIATYDRICAVDDFADYFSICVDTGHSNKAARFGEPKAEEVIRMLGSRISSLHLNDNDSLTDQHKAPGMGNINWTGVLNALDEVGYSGTYNLELALDFFGPNLLEETAAFSIKITQEMLRNHYANK